MDDSTVASVITFSVYLLAMFAMGAWFYRRNNDLSDFALGGRRLGSVVAAISAKASDSSAWVFLGLPGAFYVSGLANVWMIFGLTAGFYVSWLVLARRLRDHSEHGLNWRTGRAADSVTLPGFLANRFQSDVLRIVSAVVILGFYVVYLGAGFVATGVLFEQILGVPVTTGVLLGASAVMVYSCLGGFLATSYTDVVQGCMMFVSLAVVSITAVVSAGGPAASLDAIASYNGDLTSLFTSVEASDDGWLTVGPLGIVAIVSALAWSLGYLGQPHILARFMGIRSSKSVKTARRLGLFFSITLLGFAGIVGMLAIAHFGPDVATPENAYLELVATLLPAWLAGIFLAGILAAIMSTADSQLVVAATTLSEDFYRSFVNRDASNRTLVWITRATVLAVSAVAALLALRGGTVLDLVSYAWAGFGAAFGPVILAALYSRRTTWVGALGGLVAGGVTVVVYRALDTIGLYEIIPGFAAGLIAIWLGNRFGPMPSPSTQENFDQLLHDSEKGSRKASVPAH